MRYREVCERFRVLVDARTACSREWRLSETVVMCVEFDIFEAARMEIAPLEHSRPYQRISPFIRVVFFDAKLAVRIDASQLSPPELVRAAELRTIVNAWASDELEQLPPSTSTVIAERLRDPGRVESPGR